MTSINAMKFDFDRGALLCDENRHWNGERMKIWAVEKIKDVVEDRIKRAAGLLAFYGNTGTSTVGDEIRATVRKRVSSKYADYRALGRKRPPVFMTIEDVAREAFAVICGVRHSHIDGELLLKYGFSAADYIRGEYESGGGKAEIAEKSVVKEVAGYFQTHPRRPGPAKALFGNSGIIAGYEPSEGFRIYHISQSEQFVQPVPFAYLALGSALDTANSVYTDFLRLKTKFDRNGHIDPAEGIVTMIQATSTGSRHNAGVGGYWNIILVDGTKKAVRDRMRRVAGHRSKLAMEVSACFAMGLASRKLCLESVKRLVFTDEPFERAHAAFWRGVKDPKKVHRFLRGYKSADWLPHMTPPVASPMVMVPE